MTADALRRLQALHSLTRTGSTPAVLAAVQGDLQTVIEAVLALAGEHEPVTPEPESAALGRIGWLRLTPRGKSRLLTREVPDGWTCTDDADTTWLAKKWPDAEFTPIHILADDEVAVKRDVLDRVMERLERARLSAMEDGRIAAANALQNSIDALEAGEDRG